MNEEIERIHKWVKKKEHEDYNKGYDDGVEFTLSKLEQIYRDAIIQFKDGVMFELIKAYGDSKIVLKEEPVYSANLKTIQGKTRIITYKPTAIYLEVRSNKNAAEFEIFENAIGPIKENE